MPNRKKVSPRTSFVVCRVTPQEKKNLEQDATNFGKDFSEYIRSLLGLREGNE